MAITKSVENDPFQYTGLDYLGSLYVKYGVELKKAWVCLFTCLTIRAIHLEQQPNFLVV